MHKERFVTEMNHFLERRHETRRGFLGKQFRSSIMQHTFIKELWKKSFEHLDMECWEPLFD